MQIKSEEEDTPFSVSEPFMSLDIREVEQNLFQLTGC